MGGAIRAEEDAIFGPCVDDTRDEDEVHMIEVNVAPEGESWRNLDVPRDDNLRLSRLLRIDRKRVRRSHTAAASQLPRTIIPPAPRTRSTIAAAAAARSCPSSGRTSDPATSTSSARSRRPRNRIGRTETVISRVNRPVPRTRPSTWGRKLCVCTHTRPAGAGSTALTSSRAEQLFRRKDQSLSSSGALLGGLQRPHGQARPEHLICGDAFADRGSWHAS